MSCWWRAKRVVLLVLACLVGFVYGQPSPKTVVRNCGKDDKKCWETLAKSEAARASAAWGDEGTCRNGVGPGCSQEEQQRQENARQRGAGDGKPPRGQPPPATTGRPTLAKRPGCIRPIVPTRTDLAWNCGATLV